MFNVKVVAIMIKMSIKIKMNGLSNISKCNLILLKLVMYVFPKKLRDT